MMEKIMLQNYFKQSVSALEKKLNQKVTGRRRFVYEMIKYGSRIFNNDRILGLTNAFVPYEIFDSMNISGMFIEYLGALISLLDNSEMFIKEAENMGYSTDNCSYHRAGIGLIMKGLITEPEILVGSSIPCDGSVKTLKRIGEFYNKDVFIINVPIDASESSLDYLVKQYENLIDYIEDKTGNKLDEHKLKKSIEYNNQAREYMLETYELCKNVPSPSNSRDFNNFIIFMTTRGTKEGVEIAKIYRDELHERINNGISGMADEKHRLLWFQNRIQFKNNVVNHLEEQYGAKIVFDELNQIWWEPMNEDDPLRSYAKQWINCPAGGTAERRIKHLTQLVKDYKIDGVINSGHLGCRQSLGESVIIKNALQKMGIPVVELNIDCVDKRNYSPGQLHTRIEAFMEMLENAKN
ncbi:MAG: 2-hydroxyacyl-CoA dehydratase subunit D [Promethearchaeota archaeon]